MTVNARINGYYEQLSSLTSNSIFQDPRTNISQINSLLEVKNKEWGYIDVFVADTSGIAIKNSINISSREYFQKALSGKNAISDPLISKSDGKMSVFVAVPIKNAAGSVVGVLVASMDGITLSKMITDITYAKTGYAFIANNKGTIIAHPNKDTVYNQENHIEMAKKDSGLNELAALEMKMVNGENGIGKYLYKGVNKYLAYYQVGSGTGWTLAIGAPIDEVFEDVYTLAKMVAVASAGFIILSIFGAIFIAGTISRPIKKAVSYADMLSKGDLSFEVDEKDQKRNDELGILAKAFNKISANMNNVLSSINSAAQQVNTGAKHVADSSMSLSQGATEQASSVEQLSASIEQISAQTSHNAVNAKNADKIAESASTSAEQGNLRMKELLSAMNEINISSKNISRIISVIDGIAFQTNILALNAAVEAARAGEYGKGFAVVAEEVRNLAARSASAAKETTDMIEGSIKNIENGVKIANETSDALNMIVVGFKDVAGLVKDIAKASNEQAAGLSQVTQGIMQVSTVVQSNSAISEESAASSEEMSAQAKMLEEQIGTFRLKA